MNSRTGRLQLVLVALLAVAPRAIHAQHAPPSLCSDREKREWLRLKIEPLMLSADSATTAERRQLRLPLVHPDSIRYIDDERICARAAQVYYRGTLGPRPLRGVSVARVGDMWVVYGENHMGEWTIMDVYDPDFELVASVGV